jgi:hypothetical protein
MCKRLVRSMSFSSRTTSLFPTPIERPDAQKPSSPALARGHCRSGPPDSRFQLRLVRAGLAERRVRLVARTTCAPERRTPAGRTIVRPPSPPAVWPATRSSPLPSGVLRNAHELQCAVFDLQCAVLASVQGRRLTLLFQGILSSSRRVGPSVCSALGYTGSVRIIASKLRRISYLPQAVTCLFRVSGDQK